MKTITWNVNSVHAVAARFAAVTADQGERKPTSGAGKPSDHASVIFTLAPDG